MYNVYLVFKLAEHFCWTTKWVTENLYINYVALKALYSWVAKCWFSKELTSWLLWKARIHGHGGPLQPLEMSAWRELEAIWEARRAEDPRFSTALPLNVYFWSWSLRCGLGGVFKTNVDLEAPRVGWPSRECVTRSKGGLATLTAWSPASHCPSPLPGPYFSCMWPRPPGSVEPSWGCLHGCEAKTHITGWLCLIGFPIHFP